MDEMNLNRPVLGTGETILWSGKPKKSAFIATKSLAMLPIAVLWMIFDFTAIAGVISGGANLFLLAFFAVHLMPVWIWLANVITASRRWRNTTYYVTNRRIILQSGFLAVNEESLFYKDIRNVRVSVDILDKVFGTGDICFNTDLAYHNNRKAQAGSRMEDLENAQTVYSNIQRIIMDIQTDIEYPNAYRPEQNPGYNTDYRP